MTDPYASFVAKAKAGIVPHRKKSKLTQIGDEASTLAKRQVLLLTLNICKWNLTKAAEALELTSQADVYKAIKELGLNEEYEAAKERGDISMGRKPLE